jgi:acyl-coenzyme A synthetase/AMP-(fatty) acid ligase
MSPPEILALRDYLGRSLMGRTISDSQHVVSLSDVLNHTCFENGVSQLSGRSVLLAASSQLITAVAMIEIDGIAARMLLWPPDLNPDYAGALIQEADLDAIVTDEPQRWCRAGVTLIAKARLPEPVDVSAVTERASDWLMLTSGTSGAPKIVRHSLKGLCGAIVAEDRTRGNAAVWATFYDIRRYGGLQILLRAIIGGGSMVLSDPDQTLADYVARLSKCGVTHISGTPSHWRKLLMSGSATGFAPSYVRLSGEIADQTLLDGLKRAFPQASIGHAYASTEAGVGFTVDDGREGFPASVIGQNRDGVELKVVDGSLCVRSTRTAHAYVGKSGAQLMDEDGFVDTGDMVELRGERYYFIGRRGGIINVGGLKVHPEEIEAVINQHAAVSMSRVKGRKSPITGSIVVADIVLAEDERARAGEIRDEVLARCREHLASYKVPAAVRFIETLDVTSAGKLARVNAQ